MFTFNFRKSDSVTKPVVRITGGVQGSSSEMVLKLARYLLSHESFDTEIYQVLQTYAIVVVPSSGSPDQMAAVPGKDCGGVATPDIAPHPQGGPALLSIHLRGSHQNIQVAKSSSQLMDRSCRLLAENYLRQMSGRVKDSCDGGHVVQGRPTGSTQLELEVGVSCCPNPKEADLIKMWNRHKKSLLDLLGNLQGIHLKVANTNDNIKVGNMNLRNISLLF